MILRQTVAVAVALAGVAGALAADAPPAWNGWWLPTPAFVPLASVRASPPPLKPAAMDQLRAAWAALEAGGVPDYCTPLKFTGYSWGNSSEVELLATPGRITLIADDGLVRRIYLDGADAPPDPPATNSGTSMGRWQGDTLVVETTGLDPNARYPFPLPGAPAIGEKARVIERIRLTDPDTLVFEVETTAPDILAGPDRRTFTYRRIDMTISYAQPLCVESDRSVDLTTGQQRFDMTPPRDLPPPPD